MPTDSPEDQEEHDAHKFAERYIEENRELFNKLARE